MTITAVFLGLEDECWGAWALDHEQAPPRLEVACCYVPNAASYDPTALSTPTLEPQYILTFLLDRQESEARQLIDPNTYVYRREPLC